MFPSRVTLVDVGPRDGLQNEKQPVATEHKVALVHALQAAAITASQLECDNRPLQAPTAAPQNYSPLLAAP